MPIHIRINNRIKWRAYRILKGVKNDQAPSHHWNLKSKTQCHLKLNRKCKSRMWRGNQLHRVFNQFKKNQMKRMKMNLLITNLLKEWNQKMTAKFNTWWKMNQMCMLKTWWIQSKCSRIQKLLACCLLSKKNIKRSMRQRKSKENQKRKRRKWAKTSNHRCLRKKK